MTEDWFISLSSNFSSSSGSVYAYINVTAIPKIMIPTTAQISPTWATTLKKPKSMRTGRGFFFAYLSGFFLYIGIPYFCSIRAMSLDVTRLFLFGLLLSSLSFSDIYIPPLSTWLNISVLSYYTTDFLFFQVLCIINNMNNPLQADYVLIKTEVKLKHFIEKPFANAVFNAFLHFRNPNKL